MRCYPKTYVEAFRPMVIVLVFLGLSPTIVKIETTVTSTYSKLGLLMTLLNLVTCCYCLSSYGFSDEKYSPTDLMDQSNLLIAWLDEIETAFLFIAIVVVFTATVKEANRFTRLIELCVTCDDEYKLIDSNTEQLYKDIYIDVWKIMVLSLFMVIAGLVVKVQVYHSLANKWPNFEFYGAKVLPQFYLSYVIIQYVVWVMTAKRYFNRVNIALLKIAEKYDFDETQKTLKF